MIQTTVNPALHSSADNDPGYGQLLAVLIRRFPWFLAVFLSSIAIAGILSKRTPPTYKSSMQLLVEPNYQGKAQGDANQNQANQAIDPSFQVDTATQLNLMRNSEHIEKAVDVLKGEYPDLTVAGVKRSLVLSQIKEKEDNLATKIFLAEITGNDPIKTQRLLEVLQKVYLDYNKEQQNERLRRGLKVINEQLDKVRKELTDSESRLLRFRKTQNLTDPEAEAKTLEQSLTGVEQDQRNVSAQYQEAIARYDSLQSQLKRTPQNALVSARLSQSTRYQSLLNEIQKTDLELEKERLRFTEEAPSVRKLVEQRQRQQLLLQQEAGATLGQNPNVAVATAQSIGSQGNDSQIDLNLAAQLVENQTNILGLRARYQSLGEKQEQLRNSLKRFPALLAEYNRLKPAAELTRERYEQLVRTEQQLRQELDKGQFDWKVVEKAAPGDFVGPNLQQNLMLGGVVGLILGGIAAAMREASDDSVHTTAELEKQMALPLLGTTPKLPPAKTRESIIKLPFGKPEATSPWTIQVLQSPPRWESLDLIYKNIELVNTVATIKSMMITSALADEGKSALALGLAMSAARLHKRVLLIDANLREPTLHKQLNLPNEQGLSSLLASDTDLSHQINLQSSGSSFIDILTAGPTPADPANLLSSPRMKQLMAAFEENYDLVLIDAPPVLGLVDALLAGSACRSTVMVASIGRVTRTQLSQATAMLSKLNLIGVVANGVSNASSTYIPYPRQDRFALQEAVEK
ncbi:polysaccharide biosynthesis tyrosine autokinase [Calothrix sp. UHCC 0171]|uniref:GumC family protein n=1 Tax=Calothrix sp. UHCC 0171 TaxID=3110245 RepID=UPI002B1E9F28|nr:polysaccharide biosynthesis tyrosine autokinase [Calothrix sp. UHCC 0171]MEA5571609.1 polysaccharide biosynthesis tyrosine autokinase [Calothrix sp. UHCC 0171]